MKRLLIVSYRMPPEPAAGAVRPGYIARYLPAHGWDVRVVTHSTGADDLQERFRQAVAARAGDPNSLVRRTLRALKYALLFPDLEAPWILHACKAGTRLLEQERFDAILSTALPASAHVVAAYLAWKSGLPWIADYRDPWAGNAYVKRGPIRTFLEHTFERLLLRRANAMTTISAPIAAHLADFHRRDDVAVIPNAYDPAEWDGIPQTAPQGFALCYTGSMYDGRRSPDLLFAAIRDLAQAHDPAALAARVHFFGRNSDNVVVSAREHDVSSQVHYHGQVPRRQAMEAQRKAAALLLFLNMDPRTASEMGSKFLEYLGARRPIIAFGPENSVMREVIERNNLGWFASNLHEAKAALASAYARFSAGNCELRVDAMAFPTANELASRFARIADAVSGTARAGEGYAARALGRS